jgi:hypothetical protein
MDVRKSKFVGVSFVDTRVRDMIPHISREESFASVTNVSDKIHPMSDMKMAKRG